MLHNTCLQNHWPEHLQISTKVAPNDNTMPPKKSKNTKKKASVKAFEAAIHSPSSEQSPSSSISTNGNDFFTFSSPVSTSESLSDSKSFKSPKINRTASSSTTHSPATTPSVSLSSQDEIDNVARATAFKEEGNEAFKAQKYDRAVELYAQAIRAFSDYMHHFVS